MALTADTAKVEYEAGQTLVSLVELTDSGDHKTFNTASQLISDYAGYTAVWYPNGVKSGGAITPATSGTNDLIDVAQLVCNLQGVETTVSADTDVDAARSATGGTPYKISSITVDSSGAIAVVEGTSHTAFSETRAASGGPPLLPVKSVEVGQIRMSSATAAAITSAEIFDTPNTHKEMATTPGFRKEFSRVVDRVIGYGGITFTSALQTIHTGSVAKKVYAQYYTPIFTELPDSTDMTPPGVTGSVSSTKVYNNDLGSTSTSLNAGSVSMYPEDGVTDDFLGRIGKNMWFRFYPDRLKDPYIIFQAKPYESGSFPADALTALTFSLNATVAADRVTG